MSDPPERLVKIALCKSRIDGADHPIEIDRTTDRFPP